MTKEQESGMALPMVLWTIALLAGIVVLLVGVLDGWISEETRSGKNFQARQQALSGIAVGRVVQQPGDPILQHSTEGGAEGYSVVIKDESGLINPNAWLGVTPDRRDLFQKLFTAWGLDMNQCAAAADGLYDWQSPNPFRSLHGAKQPEYEAAHRSGLPPGEPFVSPEEMSFVIGFWPVTQAKPTWKSYFSTLNNLPKINILHAPKVILTDLLGLTPAQADAWITQRNGKDGIEGTDDDLKPSNIEQVEKIYLAANSAQKAIISDTCDITGSIRRIESTGYCNGVKHLITVVVGSNSLLGWSEQ
jgi:type II secretory pathway component PulK